MVNDTKNAILIYSRLGSSRLPCKAFKTVGHYKLVELIIERLRILEKKINVKIILATTDNPFDDKLVQFALDKGVSVFRGDEDNVMKRTLNFIENTDVDNICRVNGDCPFVDYQLLLSAFYKLIEGYDLVTNIQQRTFPYGVAVEWFTSKLYKEYYHKALKEEKEHVTMHLYRYLNEIKYYNIVDKYNNSNLSLTIDTLQDYRLVSSYFKDLTAEEQLNLTYKQLLNL